MKSDDPDARVKFLAEEELCRAGGPVFDANGKPCCQRIEKEELCDGRDEEEQTSIPSRSKQGGF